MCDLKKVPATRTLGAANLEYFILAILIAVPCVPAAVGLGLQIQSPFSTVSGPLGDPSTVMAGGSKGTVEGGEQETQTGSNEGMQKSDLPGYKP